MDVRTHIHSRGLLKKGGLVASALIAISIASSAVAEPLRANGTYEQAKLAKITDAAASVPENAPTFTGTMRKWARSQWRVLKSYLSDETVKVAEIPANRKPAFENQSLNQSASQTEAQIRQENSHSQAAAIVPVNAPPAVKLQSPPTAATLTGVASYDLSSSPAIPRLKLEIEEKISKDTYGLDSRLQKIMNDRVVHALETPELLTENALKTLVQMRAARAGEVVKVEDIHLPVKGRVSTSGVDKIGIKLRPEAELKLAKVVPLTAEEVRFLSGLLLFQKGDQCPTAIGLFHKLSKSKGWEAEANFYVAVCSKKLGLRTDFYERAAQVLDSKDVHYSGRILTEIDSDVPYEISDRFGNALLKAAGETKIIDGLSPDVLANVAYDLADFGVYSERFKTALAWVQKIPVTHPKYLQAQFIQALAEYQAGSKEKALSIQEKIVNDSKTDKSKMEFQALVALNAARMHFQEQNFKAADENFHKVYKDHPLWLQSLTELGWAQLLSGDFEGAIGNMYSIHSPFFATVYKPESFVIRTIGYLSLCQYGDAYKALSILEHEYRPKLQKIERYLDRAKAKPAFYQTVKSFLTASAKGAPEVDGLPMQVIREMARHRDFTNLQKALNRQIDERPNYSKINNEVESKLKVVQNGANELRSKLDLIRKKLSGAMARKNAKQTERELREELEIGMAKLNDQFFHVDLYTEAKAGVEEYRREIIAGADQRIVGMRGRMENVLANRLLRMKVELARMLDNNELLRYEVFAGSGENLRYQVAGGETGKRVSASVLPKSKSLQWEFDGEYWEDEIGHYRSSLKNNCPDKQHAQASLNGGVK
jgi:tetratricopeptide (TPR) repeat protein